MSLPDPVRIGRWWSYPEIILGLTLNQVIGVVRRLIEQGGDDDSEAIERLTRELSDLRAAHEQLRTEFEKLRDLDRPRIVTKPGLPQDKEI